MTKQMRGNFSVADCYGVYLHSQPPMTTRDTDDSETRSTLEWLQTLISPDEWEVLQLSVIDRRTLQEVAEIMTTESTDRTYTRAQVKYLRKKALTTLREHPTAIDVLRTNT